VSRLIEEVASLKAKFEDKCARDEEVAARQEIANGEVKARLDRLLAHVHQGPLPHTSTSLPRPTAPLRSITKDSNPLFFTETKAVLNDIVTRGIADTSTATACCCSNSEWLQWRFHSQLRNLSQALLKNATEEEIMHITSTSLRRLATSSARVAQKKESPRASTFCATELERSMRCWHGTVQSRLSKRSRSWMQ